MNTPPSTCRPDKDRAVSPPAISPKPAPGAWKLQDDAPDSTYARPPLLEIGRPGAWVSHGARLPCASARMNSERRRARRRADPQPQDGRAVSSMKKLPARRPRDVADMSLPGSSVIRLCGPVSLSASKAAGVNVKWPTACPGLAWRNISGRAAAPLWIGSQGRVERFSVHDPG